MEGITKICNKCKKDLPVEDFGENGKGVWFKRCDECRLRGRAENTPSRLRKKAELGTSTSQVQDKAPADGQDGAPAAVEELTNNTVLCLANKKQFVRSLFNYIGEKLPD